MKRIQLICIVLITASFTSCFEIIEDITINSDGSGSCKYVVNLSKSSTTIKSILLMDEIEGYVVPTKLKIKTEINKITSYSEKIEGISNVSSSVDLVNFIFSYQCDFQSVHNLNVAIDSLKSYYPRFMSDTTTYFTYTKSKKTFKRKGDNLLKKEYEKMTETQKNIFENAEYTCLYRFNNEIDTIQSLNARLSKNKMVSFTKISMLTLVNNGNAINQEIKLK